MRWLHIYLITKLKTDKRVYPDTFTATKPHARGKKRTPSLSHTHTHIHTHTHTNMYAHIHTYGIVLRTN